MNARIRGLIGTRMMASHPYPPSRKARVTLGDPRRNSLAKRSGLFQKLGGIRCRDNSLRVIGQVIALAATAVQIICSLVGGRAKSQFQGLKSRLMSSVPFDPLTRTGNGHLCGEKRSLIGNGKAIIR